MSERTDQLSRTHETEFDAGDLDDTLLDESTEQPASDDADGDSNSRIGQYFSARMFLVVFAVLAVLGQIGSTFVPLVGGPLGLFTGAFTLGLIAGRRQYAEALIAGGLAGGLGVLFGNMTIAAVTGSMLTLAGIGVAAGAVLAVLGVYFGRDLRNGLTADI